MTRVAITTTEDRASTLVETLIAHQMEPVRLPCIEVKAAPEHVLEEARSKAANADWIVLTSQRAVDLTWPSGGMPDVSVAAVGGSTAAAVEAAGGRVEAAGHVGAAGLIATLGQTMAGRSVVFLHAAGADPSTITSLERAGARVVAIPVYETHPMAPSLDPVDAVIFGSPSAVTGWSMSRTMDGLVLAAMGKTTEQALFERGFEADVMPGNPDFAELVTALDDHMRARSPA